MQMARNQTRNQIVSFHNKQEIDTMLVRRSIHLVGKQVRHASTITGIHAREVLDSRGYPTIEVDLTTKDGQFRSIVPSGRSTGSKEACELRDGGNRYNGKGVLKAVSNVNNELRDHLIGMSVEDQQGLDQSMISLDGTTNKQRLGANAILAVSMAAARAGAASCGVPLYQHIATLAGNNERNFTMPVPCFNVINGGKHALNRLAFQEFFVIPTGAGSFKEALQIGSECYHSLKKVLTAKYGGDATLIGDEGGFAPPVDAVEGFEVLMEAIHGAGHEDKVQVGLDPASSEFKVPGEDSYDLDFKRTGPNKNVDMILSGDQLSAYYGSLIDRFPIVILEDPFGEDDWENWQKYMKATNGSPDVEIVADDLTVTNVSIIQKAIETNSANGLLLKLNQIGTLTESIDAVKLAKLHGWGVFTSHRSGETEDTFIADLAVGLCCAHIKSGSPARSERTAKYNQLVRIEEQLGPNATYAGHNFRRPPWMGQ
mmetsp:Transcript_10546/g.19748  ORF Transcript_10546/g.19748 Transcript_10546/m.19748 type:complete len:484 (-) Transcript_10546:549-2000(-)